MLRIVFPEKFKQKDAFLTQIDTLLYKVIQIDTIFTRPNKMNTVQAISRTETNPP